MIPIKSQYKICKRLGVGIFEKCQTQKFTLSEARALRSKKRGRRRVSDYGKQLLEKQKMRFMYGISEKQFSKYVRNSTMSENPQQSLYAVLENRLDNVVYRLGFAKTRRSARQMVSHGHILLNNKKTTIPSVQVRVGATVSIKDSSQDSALFNHLRKMDSKSSLPKWLKLGAKAMSAEIIGKPDYKDIDSILNPSVVFEYYSR